MRLHERVVVAETPLEVSVVSQLLLLEVGLPWTAASRRFSVDLGEPGPDGVFRGKVRWVTEAPPNSFELPDLDAPDSAPSLPIETWVEVDGALMQSRWRLPSLDRSGEDRDFRPILATQALCLGN